VELVERGSAVVVAAGGCRVNTGCTGFAGPAGVYSSGAVRAPDVCRFRDTQRVEPR
jgi:hypothetical protein